MLNNARNDKEIALRQPARLCYSGGAQCEEGVMLNHVLNLFQYLIADFLRCLFLETLKWIQGDGNIWGA